MWETKGKADGENVYATPSGAAGDEIVITARYSENTAVLDSKTVTLIAPKPIPVTGISLLPEKADSVAGLLGGCNAARMVHAAGRDESSGKVDVRATRALRQLTKRRALLQC